MLLLKGDAMRDSGYRGHPKISDDALKAMVESGMAAKQVAIECGMSRQGVYQRMKKLGLEVRPYLKRAGEPVSAKYGIPMSEVRHLYAIGATRAFVLQKRNARARGIPWELTLKQWWSIWQESGKWEMRGRTKGCFVMGRPGDVGPYAVGNVVICTHRENILEREKHHPSTFRLKAADEMAIG